MSFTKPNGIYGRHYCQKRSRACISFGLMDSNRMERIHALLLRIDELCREAAEIREKLEKTSRERRPWPDPRSVSRLFTGSSPSDINPASADDSKKKN